jgi:hypothetical protein
MAVTQRGVQPLFVKNVDSFAEIIKGPKIKEILYSLIVSGKMCKMEVSRTPFCWLTVLSEVREEGGKNILLIDRIPDFEKAHSTSGCQEVLVEYLENGGIPCNFTARVNRIDGGGIWVDFPEEIRRVQRRTYFRLRAPAGTEIVFQAEPGKNEKGLVRDYSLGGVAFLIGKRVNLKPGDRVKDLLLRIPEGSDWLTIPLPQGVVKRAEPDFYQGQTLYALQVLELPESTRHVLNQHIFEKQRLLLRWVKK